MTGSGRLRAVRAVVAFFAASVGLGATGISPAAAASPVQLSVQAGYHNSFKLGQWMPVAVDVTNNGPNFEGTLEIQPDSAFGGKGGAPGGSAVYVAPLSLAAGTTKHFKTYVSEDNPTAIAVRVTSGGRTVASQQASVSNTTSILIAVLSDQPATLDQLAAVHPGGFTPSIAHLAAADLPDSGLVLRAFDMIAIDDFATDTLTAAQRTALSDYVLAGGSLLLGTGGTWHKTLAGLPEAIVPMAVTGATMLSAPASLAGLHGLEVATGTASGTVWMAEGRQPLLVERTAGDGVVTMATFDWNQEALTTWTGSSQLLRTVFVRSTFNYGVASTILGGAGNGGFSASQRGSNLTQALSNLPALNLPAWWLIGSLVLVYVLLVGPVNYFVLRAINRRALAWVTVPAIAIVAAGGAYGTGLITKGTAVTANEMSIVHVASGWDRAYEEAYTGILTPTRGDYEVSIAGPKRMISPLYTFGGGFPDPNLGLLRVNTVNEAITMPSMTAFTLRGFASERMASAPHIVASASLTGGKLAGTVRNESTLHFTDGVALSGNSFQKLGSLGPGESASFSLLPSVTNPMNGPPVYQTIYANAFTCCPPQSQNNSEAEREAEIKFAILNMLPVNGFKGIVVTAQPTVLLWTRDSFQDIAVNGGRPHAYVENAVVLSIPVSQVGAGLLGGGLVTGRIVDIDADVQQQGGPPGLIVTQTGGSIVYDFAPPLAPGAHLTRVSVSASNPYGIKGSPGGGAVNVSVKGQAWDWTRSQWVDVLYLDSGETTIPDNAVNPATGEVKLKLSGDGPFTSGWMSLAGDVR